MLQQHPKYCLELLQFQNLLRKNMYCDDNCHSILNHHLLVPGCQKYGNKMNNNDLATQLCHANCHNDIIVG